MVLFGCGLRRLVKKKRNKIRRSGLSRLGDTKVADWRGVNPYNLVCIFRQKGVLLVSSLNFLHETAGLVLVFSLAGPG
jgi:hypothetical protein